MIARLITAIVLLISFVGCLLGYFGLGVTIALLVFIMLLLRSKHCLFIKVRNNFLCFSTVLITSFFLLVLITRIFLFEVYGIATESMEDTLVIGDNIIISKLHYGPLPPRSLSEIPWINIFSDFEWAKNEIPVKNSESPSRLKGLCKIKRNDIIAFFIWHKSSETLIKRCVGLPNDIVKVTDGRLFVNHLEYHPTDEAKRYYEIWYNNDEQFQLLLANLNVSQGEPPLSQDNRVLGYCLNPKQLKTLASSRWIDSIRAFMDFPYTIKAFPREREVRWTYDNLGPFKIPMAGMKIQMNKSNFLLYQKIIESYEGVQIRKEDKKYFVKNRVISHYVFKQSYLFMVGDNWNNSQDSRYWGVIPEQNVVGKATCVLFSSKERSIKWNRFFKMLN